MATPKWITIITVVTSLALFGNMVLFENPDTDISAHTNLSSTNVKSINGNSTKKEMKEKGAASEETKDTQPSLESTAAIAETTEPSEEAAKTETPVNKESSSTPVEAAIVKQPSVTEEKQEPAPISQWQPNMIQIAGSYIPYSNAGQDSGQATIDANPGAAATWGGSPVQSGSDGMNTHIIGHNPGSFNVLFSLGVGSTIEVSDASGQVSTYIVQNIVTVDDSGYGVDGTDYWDQITGTGGGERLTLQTCINDSQNLIVFAA